MAEHIYSVTELVGTSSEGIEEAIENAVKTAGKTLRNLEWFEVTTMRGHIENGKIAHYQVGLKLGLRYEKK